jgi:hypothetical protein
VAPDSRSRVEIFVLAPARARRDAPAGGRRCCRRVTAVTGCAPAPGGQGGASERESRSPPLAASPTLQWSVGQDRTVELPCSVVSTERSERRSALGWINATGPRCERVEMPMRSVVDSEGKPPRRQRERGAGRAGHLLRPPSEVRERGPRCGALKEAALAPGQWLCGLRSLIRGRRDWTVKTSVSAAHSLT